MYEIFEMLLKKKGVKTAEVCRETGIKSPVFSEWKKGKSSPNVDKLILIAKYFNVSVEYLRTGKEPTDNKYSAEMAMLVGKIRNDKELSEALLKYFELSDEKKKHIINTINMM